ncbi:MAG: Ig-like domain-containing protein, partial [Omnitrophica bacterium]|nr:Ig-like domain-containing protein [Candidatus Omnitrophota bacterium]
AYKSLFIYTPQARDGLKTVYARYKDKAGNVLTVQDTITIDTTGPAISITGPADTSTVDTGAPLLSYTILDNFDPQASTYYVMVDGRIVTKRSGENLDALSDGKHTVKIASRDHLGNMGYNQITFTVDTGADTVPPTGSILIENDAEYARAASVELNLTASDNMTPEETIEIAFSNDGTSFTAWEEFYTRKRHVMPDGDGTKTVYVKFRDEVGNESSAYSDTITLDTAYPVITITSPEKGRYYDDITPLLEYAVDDGNATVTVKLDGSVIIAPSGQDLPELTDGNHTVTIDAKDLAGNLAASSVLFRVGTTPPVISIITPADRKFYNDTTPLLRYVIDDPDVTVTLITLDENPTDKRNGQELPALSDGEHTLFMEVEDRFGRTSSVSSVFTIDTVAPSVSIVTPSDGLFTNDATPVVDYEIDDPGALAAVKVDMDWVGTKDGEELPALEDGEHTLTVKAVDVAGNTSFASHIFTVDTVAPDVIIRQPQDGFIIGAIAPLLLYEINDLNSAAVIAVKLDGVKVDTRNGERLPELDSGTYTVRVEAEDPAMNIGFAQSTFTVEPGVVTIEEIQITSDNENAFQGNPAIHKNKITWTDVARGYNIYMYDLATGEETSVSPVSGALQGFSDIYEGKIVWTDSRNGRDNYDIYMYDLATNEEIQITSGERNQSYPAIYGDRIVWRSDPTDKTRDIYMYDLAAGEKSRISFTSTGVQPAIHEDRIVYVAGSLQTPAIYMYDIATGETVPIATGSTHKSIPAIYGDRIVWAEANERGGLYDIYMYDIATGETVPIATGPTDQFTPAIYEDRIVWADRDKLNGTYGSIYMYDLATGEEILIVTGATYKYHPDIYEDKIVWSDWRNADPPDAWMADVYMAILYYLPYITAVNPTTVSAGGLLTITGNNFASLKRASYIEFTGGVQATEYLSWSNTEVKCKVPDGAQSGEVKLTNLAGQSNGFEIVIGIDPSHPFIPENLVAIAVNCARINLTWDASTDPESGIDHYNVYRDSVKVGESTTTDYHDKALDASTAYTYEVSAVNGASFESGSSYNAYASTAIAGDTNADNVVNIFDLVLVAKAFGSVLGDPNWDERADITDTWDAVTISDLIMVATHFGDTL